MGRCAKPRPRRKSDLVGHEPTQGMALRNHECLRWRPVALPSPPTSPGLGSVSPAGIELSGPSSATHSRRRLLGSDSLPCRALLSTPPAELTTDVLIGGRRHCRREQGDDSDQTRSTNAVTSAIHNACGFTMLVPALRQRRSLSHPVQDSHSVTAEGSTPPRST